MPIPPFPTRTDGSFGRDKSDVAPPDDFQTQAIAGEYDNIANWLISVINEIGNPDGSQPGTLWESALTGGSGSGDVSATTALTSDVLVSGAGGTNVKTSGITSASVATAITNATTALATAIAAQATANSIVPAVTTDNAVVTLDLATGELQETEVTITQGPFSTARFSNVTVDNQLESLFVQAKEWLQSWKDFEQIEQSAATRPIAAGRASWWVKDDAPCTPQFRDDVGTNHNLLTPEGASLRSTGEAEFRILETDGAGGTRYANKPTGGGTGHETFVQAADPIGSASVGDFWIPTA